jgi:hypothetical protein
MKDGRLIIIYILVIFSLSGLMYMLKITKEGFNDCKVLFPINPDDLNCGPGYFVNRFADQKLTCCRPPPPPPPPYFSPAGLPHVHPGM